MSNKVFNIYKSKSALHLRLHRRMSVENETTQEGRGTSHSEEAHAERAASANVVAKFISNYTEHGIPFLAAR